MAEQIELFGKRYPKNAVYVVGAAAAGVIGYAWWTRGTETTETLPEEELPLPVEEPTDEPGFTVTGGGPVPMTNADWNELAVDRLANSGYDAIAVRTALGKFLARARLTKTEVNIVQAALAAAGPPPQNGPWHILEEIAGSIPPPVTRPSIRNELHRIGRVGQTYGLRDVARRYAPVPSNPDSVEAMLRRIVGANPQLRGRTTVPGGYPLIVPVNA